MRIINSPRRAGFGDTNMAVADIILWSEKVTNVINNLVTNIPADSTAATVADLRTDFNALLAVLRGLSIK